MDGALECKTCPEGTYSNWAAEKCTPNPIGFAPVGGAGSGAQQQYDEKNPGENVGEGDVRL